MDLSKTISDLYAQREKLVRTIAVLEELQAATPGRIESSPPRGRRGRKSMPKEERRSVSERMKKYWAQRRSAVEGKGR